MMKLEKQLETLSGFGIAKHVDVDDILIQIDRKALEDRPFCLLFPVLGSNDMKSSVRQLWHFDRECIVNGHSYVEIAERLAIMANVEDCFSEFSYSIDEKTQKPKLSFVANGKRRTFQVKLKDDWVDLKVLHNLMASVEKKSLGAFFEYGSWGYDDMTIIYASEANKGKFFGWGKGLLDNDDTFFKLSNFNDELYNFLD